MTFVPLPIGIRLLAITVLLPTGKNDLQFTRVVACYIPPITLEVHRPDIFLRQNPEFRLFITLSSTLQCVLQFLGRRLV